MGDNFASGIWQVRAGEAERFIERWRAFLGWTREEHPGLESASLIRSTTDANRFVSFAHWRSADDREKWKVSEGFASRFAACRELCDEFTGGDFERVAVI